MSDYLIEPREYNVGEFLEFVAAETQKPGRENNRYELIDGQIYMMSSPKGNHVHLTIMWNLKYFSRFQSILSDING